MSDARMASRWLPLVTGAVLLLLLTVPCAFAAVGQADINRDGSIDESDMTIMRAEMGRANCASAPCRADLNGDGRVNDDDMEMLKRESEGGTNAADDEEAAAEQIRMVPEEEGAPLFFNQQPAEEPSPDTGAEQEAQEAAKPVSTRFTDNKDGTIIDTQTGLMWTKNGDLCGDTVLFHQALDYIEAMNRGTHPNAGFSDWRLPTRDELRSLLDFTKLSRPSAALPQGHPFDNLQSISYNKTSYLSNTEHDWFVSLYCRLVGHNVETCFGHVWAVRGGR